MLLMSATSTVQPPQSCGEASCWPIAWLPAFILTKQTSAILFSFFVLCAFCAWKKLQSASFEILSYRYTRLVTRFLSFPWGFQAHILFTTYIWCGVYLCSPFNACNLIIIVSMVFLGTQQIVNKDFSTIKLRVKGRFV